MIIKQILLLLLSYLVKQIMIFIFTPNVII